MESKSASINNIKRELKNNNFTSTLMMLEGNSDDVLKVFKEQRLLLIPTTFEPLNAAYIDAVKRIYNDEDKLNLELNYVKFIDIYRIATADLKAQIESLLKAFKSRSLKDFFFLTNIHLENFFKSSYKEFEDMLKKNAPSKIAFEDQSVVSEFSHHV